MNFFPQPCSASFESAKLGAKHGHAKSAKFAKDFSDQKNNLFRPFCESSAFSLTEVVIAMGVAAVAFTSLMALFPLGLNMNSESYMETQSALLAKNIIEDLRDAQGGNKWRRDGTNCTLYRLLQISTNSDPEGPFSYTNIPLSIYPNSYVIYIACTNAVISNNFIMFRPSKVINYGDFTNGLPGAAAVAQIKLTQLFTELHRVEIAVDAPGSDKETNRKRQYFSGVIR